MGRKQKKAPPRPQNLNKAPVPAPSQPPPPQPKKAKRGQAAPAPKSGNQLQQQQQQQARPAEPTPAQLPIASQAPQRRPGGSAAAVRPAAPSKPQPATANRGKAASYAAIVNPQAGRKGNNLPPTARPQPTQVAKQQQAAPKGFPQQHPPGFEAWASEYGIRLPHPRSASAGPPPGLINLPGQNNCFLNSAVQILQTVPGLQAALLSWRRSGGRGNPIAYALADLMVALDRAAATGQKAPVSVDKLRATLAAYNPEFKPGAMADAAEAVDLLLESLAPLRLGGKPLAGLFKWRLREHVECAACGGMRTQDRTLEEAMQYPRAPDLRAAAAAAGHGTSLGRLLAAALAQRSCDKAEGGCGRFMPVPRTMQQGAQQPGAFILHLGYDGEREATAVLRATLNAIQPTLDMGELVRGCRPGRLRLSSVATYYGRHYVAFVTDRAGKWWRCEDAAVTPVGGWAQVKRQCMAGGLHPCLLCFADAA